MPVKNKAQWRALGAKMSQGELSKAKFDEMTHATPGGYKSLPPGPGKKKTKQRKR